MATRFEYFNTGETGESYAFKATWKAQTFTPSVEHEVTKVVLRVRRIGYVGTVTVSIRATSGGLPTGGDLCYCSMAGSSIGTTSSWVEFIMNVGVTLAAGNTYAIVVRASAGSMFDDLLYWSNNATGGYAGGQVCGSSDSGASWTAPWSWDMFFEEQGNPLARPIGAGPAALLLAQGAI